MGYQIPGAKRVTARTSRPAGAHGTQYVVIAGAPDHYVPGYGIVGPGDIITLDEGVEPGRWVQPVNPKDAQKVGAEPEKAPELAEKAAEVKNEAVAKEEAKEAKEAAKAEANKPK